MAGKEFQMEFIQYLQESNSKLVQKLNEMQGNFENKVCSTDISKQYLLSALAGTLNICNILPKEIDALFEKITEVISTLKNVLLIKSELEQLGEKISGVIKQYKKTIDEMEEENLCPNVSYSAASENKEKGRTVKVSPMIEGHVIATEPKIYLDKISKRSVPQQLSPIAEASPCSFLETRNSNESHFTRDSRIAIPRFQISSEKDIIKKVKVSRNWQRSLTEKRKSDCNDNTPAVPLGHIETSTPNEQNRIESEIDPLEGPSWRSENFINTKRRRNSFLSVWRKEENFDAESKNEDNAERLLLLDKEKICDNKFLALSLEASPIKEKDIKSNSNSLPDVEKTPEPKEASPELLDSKLMATIINRQPFVKLENCSIRKTSSTELNDKTQEGISPNTTSTTPGEGEGRKRRKAAPTNLTEPKLNNKLRRG